MPAARQWRARPEVALAGPADARFGLEIRLACWFERVARLIARHDTPRTWSQPAARAGGATDAPAGGE
jgi:hypothetical protein